MKKNECFGSGQKVPIVKKLLRIMKLTTFLLLISAFSVLASKSYSQTLSLTVENVTLKEVLSRIEDMSGCNFLYSQQFVDVQRKVSINAENKKIDDVLNSLFAGTDIDFERNDRLIILSNSNAYNSVSQQQKTVSGKVSDSSRAPLPGVTVVIKGTTQGTVTDFEGNYNISNVPDDGTLVFSFVGMKAQEISVTGKNSINVVLIEDAIGIEEVVAIGYGTVKKSDLTGAVSQLKAEDLKRVPSTNPIQSMQGRVSGLQIVPNSGQPGAGNNIQIRGTQSINGSNAPIFVVDGTITESIDNINPSDIESFTILKDASAVAIYGSRASNGVILVETKRGGKNKETSITFSMQQSVQEEGNLKLDFVNADQWLELSNEAWENAGLAKDWTDADLAQYDGVDVNWPDAVKRTGSMSKYDLSILGGGNNSNYFVSATYLDNNGIIKGQDFNRLNFRINTDHKIREWITFGNSLNIYSSKQNTSTDYDGRNVYEAAFRYTPLNRMYEENGDFGSIRNVRFEGRSPGALWMLDNSKVTNELKGLTGNLYLTIKLMDGLKFTTRASVEWNHAYKSDFIGAMSAHYNMEGSNVNEIEKESAQTMHWINDYILDYNKTFAKDHSVSLLLGYSTEEQTYENLMGSRGGTPNNSIRFLSAGDPNTSMNANNYYDWSFISMFGRFGYTFKDKYILSGTIRRDGTSRLAKGHKYGTFPSLSAGWRITQEDFMKDIDWLDELKVRGSWGTVGNILGISEYGTTSILTQWNHVIKQTPSLGYTLADAVNTDLTWESTTKKNIGIDANLFGNKFYLVTDYFIEDTHDLLFEQPLPPSTGLAGSPYINAGHVRNKGIDIELGYRKKVQDWSYHFSVNLSHINNKVIDLEGRDLRTSGIQESYPIWTAFGYKSNGIIRTEDELNNNPQYEGKQVGDIWLLDIDGYDTDGNLTGQPDGKVDAADRTLIGNVYPDLTYGGFASVSYKNFTLQMNFQGVSGIDRNMLGGRATDLFAGEPNVEADYVLDRFHTDKNPNGKYPRVTANDKGQNNILSDFWLRDASYLSIRNINLNYNVPNNIASKLSLSSLSFYGSVQNVYTFTSFYGPGVDTNFDPSDDDIFETNTMTSIPLPRTWTFGLTATF